MPEALQAAIEVEQQIEHLIDQDDDEQAYFCPACDGDLVSLGALGRLSWFRCRHCGAQFSTEE